MSLASVRSALSRRALPLAIIAVVPFLFAACNEVGGDVGFWDVVWGMVFFFFWFMAIWIWITCLSDIFRRNDMSGGSKAIWIVAIIFLPLLGCLIYMIMRPKMTPQDVQMLAQSEAAMKAAGGVSTADELAKLTQLRDCRHPHDPRVRGPQGQAARLAPSRALTAARTRVGSFGDRPASAFPAASSGRPARRQGRREGALAECEGPGPGRSRESRYG